jgi:serine/threonine protein kinase
MIGRTLAHYEITASLGEGEMGVVYGAHDTRLGREVAIEVLPSARSDVAERSARFVREARTLASLQHPNVATAPTSDARPAWRPPRISRPTAAGWCASPTRPACPGLRAGRFRRPTARDGVDRRRRRPPLVAIDLVSSWYSSAHDVLPDGSGFLGAIPDASEGRRRIDVVTGWFEELPERVPHPEG